MSKFIQVFYLSHQEEQSYRISTFNNNSEKMEKYGWVSIPFISINRLACVTLKEFDFLYRKT